MRKAAISLGVIVASLGVVIQANADLVVGRFDPNFGGPLNGVNYAGTANFSISQSCLNLNLPEGGAFIFAGYDCDGAGPDTNAGMGFLGAHVDFTGGQTGSVDFAANPNAILGMYVQNHLVVGVQSIVIGPATSTLPGMPHPQFDLLFGMLNPGDPGEVQVPGLPNDGDNDLGDQQGSAFTAVSMFLVSNGCTPGASVNPCTQSDPAVASLVPEPGSLALVIGALGAAGLAGRKRRGGSTH